MEEAEKADKAMKQAIKEQEEMEIQLEDWVTRLNDNFKKLFRNVNEILKLYILPIDP